MKNSLYVLILIGLIWSFSSCKGKKATGSESDSTNVQVSGIAVCIWDKVSLKESPENDGKWLTSINLGERCTYLDDEKEISNGDKKIKYIKVELQDGKQGWVQADFIVIGGKPGAIIQDAVIYSRPDLLTKTDKSFKKFDIIGIKSEQNNFVEVAGKRRDGKWIESGWIKPANLSAEDIDVAVAKYTAKALANEDVEKQVEALREIIDNPDFSSSVFIGELKDQITKNDDPEMDEEMSSDTTQALEE